MICISTFSFFFFFNDTATTEIYTLSLHDALPILLLTSCAIRTSLGLNYFTRAKQYFDSSSQRRFAMGKINWARVLLDRKSTRLNSSHGYISYAVFCLKKKKKQN